MPLSAANKDEEEVRKLSMQLRYFEQTAEALQQRLGMLNSALSDLTYANLTLEGLEKEKENAEMLVPIGGGSYVSAKLANSDKVVVGMGAGISIEKTLPEAKVILKERIEELRKTQTSAQQQLTQIVERINLDRNRMESLLTGLRAGPQ
jgi:prefoldin alpha subunit